MGKSTKCECGHELKETTLQARNGETLSYLVEFVIDGKGTYHFYTCVNEDCKNYGVVKSLAR